MIKFTVYGLQFTDEYTEGGKEWLGTVINCKL